MNRLARLGAEARLAELEREREAIFGLFPDLSGARRRRRPTAAPARRGRGRVMSAAERRAVSLRMKKYWAERRRGGAGRTAASTAPAKARRGRRKPMSAAEKRAVSLRMKKFWAERRKARG
ncbi:MAG: hypothetical protein HY654_10220 [Acidobacteria bacterium]|nr:hypothetical protein [Acidobacteriota bacterium]